MRQPVGRSLLGALLLCAGWAAQGAEIEARCGVKAYNVWDEADTGAGFHVTFYLSPAQGDYHPLGVTADNRDRGQQSTLCLVRDVSPKRDALAPPMDFVRIWWDRGSSARRDGAIWAPRCPDRYVGLGFMVQASYRKPVPVAPDAIRCVRKDLTVAAAADARRGGPDGLDGAVFKDTGSRAFEGLSVWGVKAADGFDAGTVFAWRDHAMPNEKDGPRLIRKSAVRVSE